jgi:hypothetical protein
MCVGLSVDPPLATIPSVLAAEGVIQTVLRVYRSRGIGFIEESGYVVGIAVFSPGTSPDDDGIFY